MKKINFLVKNCFECPMLDYFEYAQCCCPGSKIKLGFEMDFNLDETVHPDCPLRDIDSISIRMEKK